MQTEDEEKWMDLALDLDLALQHLTFDLSSISLLHLNGSPASAGIEFNLAVSSAFR